MFSEDALKQAAEELALTMIESLPEPEQCPYQFSERLEQKMQAFFSCTFAAQGDNSTKKP